MLPFNTSSAAAGATPIASAKASPSASTVRFKPRTRLLINFMRAALPQGPT